MKYTAEIEINRPINTIVELFDNPANMGKWMEGLQSFELLSGIPGQPGAKSRLKIKMGKRDIIMIETIKKRNLPYELIGTYEAKGVYNTVKNKFVKVSDNKTIYITEQKFQFRNKYRILKNSINQIRTTFRNNILLLCRTLRLFPGSF